MGRALVVVWITQRGSTYSVHTLCFCLNLVMPYLIVLTSFPASAFSPSCPSSSLVHRSSTLPAEYPSQHTAHLHSLTNTHHTHHITTSKPCLSDHDRVSCPLSLSPVSATICSSKKYPLPSLEFVSNPRPHHHDNHVRLHPTTVRKKNHNTEQNTTSGLLLDSGPV